jgi:hypothetical protein
MNMPPACVYSAGDGNGKIRRHPLIFLVAVSVMAWVAGMAIHGF